MNGDYKDLRHIYLVLSRTPSGFGKVIRLVSGANFNHASLAFDKNLYKLYSFGRRRKNIPINAGLVKEYAERFSLKKVDCVEVRIYKIPVTREQYELGKKRVRQIMNDEKYLYNLYSVLFFPFFKGFYTYKAFTCVEFVIDMLKYMKIDVTIDKPGYKYLPDDMIALLDYPIVFEGNLLEYDCCKKNDTGVFFDPLTSTREHFSATRLSVTILSRLAYRKVRYSHRLSKIFSLLMLP